MVQDPFGAANTAVQWIDQATEPFRKMIGEAVQEFGDMIIGAIDKLMTATVSKAGDMVGKAGEMARSASTAVKNAGENFSAFSEKSTPVEPQLARSRQQEITTDAPAIPEQAKSAVASLGMKNSEIVASQMVNMAEGQAVSPTAVAFGGQQQSMGIGA